MELNNSELSITELYDIKAAIAKQQQEQYENAVPKYTSRPTVQKEKFDDSKFYHKNTKNEKTTLTTPTFFDFKSFVLSDSTRLEHIGKFYRRKLKKIGIKAKQTSKKGDVSVVLI